MVWLGLRYGRFAVRHRIHRYSCQEGGLIPRQAHLADARNTSMRRTRSRKIPPSECPSWVTSGSPAWASECPLLGVKRTSISGDAMSAYSQTRTFGRSATAWILAWASANLGAWRIFNRASPRGHLRRPPLTWEAVFLVSACPSAVIEKGICLW